MVCGVPPPHSEELASERGFGRMSRWMLAAGCGDGDMQLFPGACDTAAVTGLRPKS